MAPPWRRREHAEDRTALFSRPEPENSAMPQDPDPTKLYIPSRLPGTVLFRLIIMLHGLHSVPLMTSPTGNTDEPGPGKAKKLHCLPIPKQTRSANMQKMLELVQSGDQVRDAGEASLPRRDHPGRIMRDFAGQIPRKVLRRGAFPRAGATAACSGSDLPRTLYCRWMSIQALAKGSRRRRILLSANDRKCEPANGGRPDEWLRHPPMVPTIVFHGDSGTTTVNPRNAEALSVRPGNRLAWLVLLSRNETRPPPGGHGLHPQALH